MFIIAGLVVGGLLAMPGIIAGESKAAIVVFMGLLVGIVLFAVVGVIDLIWR
jgi:hypothetical protein